MIRRYDERDVAAAVECDRQRRGLDAALRRAPRHHELGINSWAFSGAPASLPWHGVLSNVWLADGGYVDAAAVGTWSPSEGAVSLTQSTGAAKPAWAGGSFNATNPLGGITGSGSGTYLIGNSLASIAQSPFTIITSFVGGSTGLHYMWGWASTTNSNLMRHAISSGQPIFTRAGTGSGTLTCTSIGVVAGSRYVETFVYDGANVVHRINGVASNISGSALAGTALSLDTFSLFTFVSSTGPNSNWGNQTLRFVGIATSALAAGSYTPIENYLMARAA